MRTQCRPVCVIPQAVQGSDHVIVKDCVGIKAVIIFPAAVATVLYPGMTRLRGVPQETVLYPGMTRLTDILWGAARYQEAMQAEGKVVFTDAWRQRERCNTADCLGCPVHNMRLRKLITTQSMEEWR